jgi:hypothetical protein
MGAVDIAGVVDGHDVIGGAVDQEPGDGDLAGCWENRVHRQEFVPQARCEGLPGLVEQQVPGVQVPEHAVEELGRVHEPCQ